jgi:phenylacetate-coenzyme A ligase PaaK-like adenylate-forming protein
MEVLTEIYLRLPPAFQNAAAWWHGRRLSWWRYGPEYNRYVTSLCLRNCWNANQWSAYQAEQVKQLVRHAATSVPFYRERYPTHTLYGSDDAPVDWKNLPIVEKQQLRDFPREFVADGVDIGKMFREHTSGSTGTPLQLWWSRQTCQLNYAFHEARIRRPAGVSWGDNWAMLGGQLIVPVWRSRPPFWVWSSSYNQLYLSVYHLSSKAAPHYLEEMIRRQVKYLYGYASSLYALSYLVNPSSAKAVGLKAIFSNGEPLPDNYRHRIEETFGVRVYDTYGCSEAAFLATECPRKKLHFWPDYGVVEVLDGSNMVQDGEEGDLVATSLINWDMPLIRYRTGDRVALDPDGCGCGWNTQVIKYIGGRANDIVYTPSGRQIYLNATAVGKWSSRIREFQIVQDTLREIRLRVVPGDGYSQADGHHLLERLRNRLDPEQEIKIELNETIERTDGGKFKIVVNKLSNNSTIT